MTWMLFCTIDNEFYLFALVTDEIEAVDRFNAHVAEYSELHRRHIFMAPAIDDLCLMRGGIYSQRDMERFGFDLDRNLFVPPRQEVAAC